MFPQSTAPHANFDTHLPSSHENGHFLTLDFIDFQGVWFSIQASLKFLKLLLNQAQDSLAHHKL